MKLRRFKNFVVLFSFFLLSVTTISRNVFAADACVEEPSGDGRSCTDWCVSDAAWYDPKPGSCFYETSADHVWLGWCKDTSQPPSATNCECHQCYVPCDDSYCIDALPDYTNCTCGSNAGLPIYLDPISHALMGVGQICTCDEMDPDAVYCSVPACNTFCEDNRGCVNFTGGICLRDPLSPLEGNPPRAVEGDCECPNCMMYCEDEMCSTDPGGACAGQAKGKCPGGASVCPVSGCTETHCECTPLEESGLDWAQFITLVSRFANVGYGFAIFIAFLMILKSGYAFMTSEGEPGKVKAAKEDITAAVTGLIFFVLSFIILGIVFDVLLGMPAP